MVNFLLWVFGVVGNYNTTIFPVKPHVSPTEDIDAGGGQEPGVSRFG
jgi:hypothetical protein